MKTAWQKHAWLESYNALSEGRCFRSFSGQKLVVLGLQKSDKSSFFKLIASKVFDATLGTKLKSLREKVAIPLVAHALRRATPASRPIDRDVDASANFKWPSLSHFVLDSRKKAICV